MGPSGKTRTRTRSRRSTRKLGFKKTLDSLERQQQQTNQEVVLTSPTSTSSNDDDFPKTEGIVFEAIDDEGGDKTSINVSSSTTVCSSGCSTPKGQRFRIPEIETCPPAPKKRRVDDKASSCSVRRSPIAFFAPPDLELFFYHAFGGISV